MDIVDNRSALTEFEDEDNIVSESLDIDFYLNYKLTSSDKLFDPYEFFAQLVLDKKDFSNFSGLTMTKQRNCIIAKNLNNNLIVKANRKLVSL